MISPDGTRASGCPAQRSGSRSLRRLGPLVCLIVSLAVPQSATGEAIAYRAMSLRADGDLADWGRSEPAFVLREPELLPPQANQVTVRLAWDLELLWAAFDVIDFDRVPAPSEAAGATLYQGDSVELYLHLDSCGTARMGLCCYQIVAAPDGRFAVLQGDPLAGEIEQLEVPKRVRPEVRLEVGGAHRADGYVVEIAVPWVELGVLAPQSGQRFDLDLAWNDWTEDHPLLPEIPLDLHNLAALEHHEKSRVRPLPPTISWEEREAIVARAYFPWSLAGRRSFGYPRTWHTMRLAGEPPLPTRWVKRFGAERLAAGVVLGLLGFGSGLLLLLRWDERRRLRELLVRMQRLEEQLATAPPPVANDGTGWSAAVDDGELETAATRLEAPALRPRPAVEQLAQRATDCILRHLAEPLSVDALARQLYVSTRTLERALAETHRCTPRQLIAAVKLREAERLLRDEGLSVTEVAARLGYADPSHFSKRFKEAFRIPPSLVARRVAAAAPMPGAVVN